MAMFDKHKTSKEPSRTEEAPKASTSPPASSPPQQQASSSRVSMVGEGITIKGDVTANSNLKVEGGIEGRSVTSSQDIEVAESGIVKASLTARVVRIAGVVAGDISGKDKVIISKSGRVQGNIVAPRVQLDDGALFRGSIDMNPAEPAQSAKPKAARPAEESKPKNPSPAPAAKSSGDDGKKEPSLTLKSH
jgi:cytoskeletal protein CcmA (bactofilin family)